MININNISTREVYIKSILPSNNNPYNSADKKLNIPESVSLNISNKAKNIIDTESINKKINATFSNDTRLDKKEIMKEEDINREISVIYNRNRDEKTKQELGNLFREHYITMHGEGGIFTEEEMMNGEAKKRHPNGYTFKIPTEAEKKYAEKIWAKFTDLWEFDKISSKDRAMSYKITKTINTVNTDKQTTQEEKEKLSVLHDEINLRYEHIDYSKLTIKERKKLDELFQKLDELYNLRSIDKESLMVMANLVDKRNSIK